MMAQRRCQYEILNVAWSQRKKGHQKRRVQHHDAVIDQELEVVAEGAAGLVEEWQYEDETDEDHLEARRGHFFPQRGEKRQKRGIDG